MFKMLKKHSEVLSIIGYCLFYIMLATTFVSAMKGDRLGKILALTIGTVMIISVIYLICGMFYCLQKADNEVVNELKYTDCDDFGW